MLKALSPLRFGQLFIGENGRAVVIEPKYLVPKGLVVYQDNKEFQHTVTNAPMVDKWTRVMENYGQTLPNSPESLGAFSALFRASILPVLNQNLQSLPANFRENAVNAIRQGTAKAFNNGILFRV
jgi:hypothetical protein